MVATTPTRTREAEKAIQTYWMAAGRPTISGPIVLYLSFTILKPKSVKKRPYPTIQPDLDNYIKLVVDALNKHAWHDDAAIVVIVARKEYTTDPKEVGTVVRARNVDGRCE